MVNAKQKWQFKIRMKIKILSMDEPVLMIRGLSYIIGSADLVSGEARARFDFVKWNVRNRPARAAKITLSQRFSIISFALVAFSFSCF